MENNTQNFAYIYIHVCVLVINDPPWHSQVVSPLFISGVFVFFLLVSFTLNYYSFITFLAKENCIGSSEKAQYFKEK